MADTNENPQITVLMAVYNGSPYLRTALDSILQQTYRDFCFLIVDDASSDDTVDIVRSYDDERIRLVCLESNVGQTAALNIGLRQATTPWIARMDADDFSAPTRFEEQMRVLDADPSISCVGTHVWIFRDQPQIVDNVFATPNQHEEIRYALLRGVPIIHGSIVIKRSLLMEIGGYDERYRLTADLDLYDRLVFRCSTSNIPKPLVGIRVHRDSNSRTQLAYDEAIEICSQRLLTDNYSLKEASIIRSTWSRTLITRARFGARQHQYLGACKDLLRAIRISPNTFPWNFCLVFFLDRFSERYQAALKRTLVRFVPSFLTGR